MTIHVSTRLILIKKKCGVICRYDCSINWGFIEKL